MPPDPKPYQTLASRIVWRTNWLALREDRVRLPDGSDTLYTVVERPGSVWIVPILTDGRLALIRNYRYTVDEWLWEVPAGSIAPGMEPEEAAHHELAEELGGAADSLELISRCYTYPGQSTESAYIFLGRGVTLGQPRREPTEVMETHVFAVDEVAAMIQRGEVMDGPSVLALLLALSKIRDK